MMSRLVSINLRIVEFSVLRIRMERGTQSVERFGEDLDLDLKNFDSFSHSLMTGNGLGVVRSERGGLGFFFCGREGGGSVDLWGR